MNELIGLLTKQFGISESGAQSALTGLLGQVKNYVGDDELSRVTSAVPGLGDLLSGSTAESSGGGSGLLGGVAALAGSFLGGDKKNLLSGVAAFAESGLGAEQIGPFVQAIQGFVAEKGGSDLLGPLLSRVPDLKEFLQ